MKPTPKAEALKALAQLQEMLARDLDPLQRAQARSTAEYAIEQVGAIQELKRTRRAKKAKGAPLTPEAFGEQFEAAAKP